MTRPESIDREQLLLAACLSPDDPDRARDMWARWRDRRTDLDDVTPGEVMLLPGAWAAAGQPDDRDSGRFAGLRRRAIVGAAQAVRAARDAQRRLADHGIASALSGGVAASILPGHAGRWPLPVPELLVERASARAALARSPRPVERALGRAYAGPVRIAWRSPLRVPWPPGDAHVVAWQGCDLEVALPHRVAFDSIARTACASPIGDHAIAAAIVDVGVATGAEGFDDDAWQALVSRSGLRDALAAHAAPWSDALTGRLATLLGADGRARRRGRAMVGVLHRTTASSLRGPMS